MPNNEIAYDQPSGWSLYMPNCKQKICPTIGRKRLYMFNSKLFMSPCMSPDTEIGGGSDDFSDVVFDLEPETSETEESEATAEPETTEDTTEVEKEAEVIPGIMLKYNHEEKEYTMDDTKTLAQKGLNYDKLQEKLNAFEADPRLAQHSKFKAIADSYGMSEDEYITALQDQYFDSAAEKQGLTPAQVKRDYELSTREKAQTQREQASTTQQQSDRMYNNFNANFPDVKPESIKPDTWARVEAGMDLSQSYGMQQNQELMAEMKVLKQNAENSKRAPVGGVTGHGSDTAKADKIFEGFDE